jgi:hypothetical protein
MAQEEKKENQNEKAVVNQQNSKPCEKVNMAQPILEAVAPAIGGFFFGLGCGVLLVKLVIPKICKNPEVVE